MKFEMTHEMIRVFDLERSLKFYDDALGFKENRRKDVPEDKFTLVFLRGADNDFELELTYNYDPEEPYTIGSGYGHLAVLTADLEGAREEHMAKGYEVTPIYEGRYYFIQDPDGYRIEIIRK